MNVSLVLFRLLGLFSFPTTGPSTFLLSFSLPLYTDIIHSLIGAHANKKLKTTVS